MLPSYISQLIPPTVGNSSHYNLRDSNNITMQVTRTTTFKRSGVHSAINLWNKLDLDIRQKKKKKKTTMSPFSYTLRSQIIQAIVPHYYTKGNRKLSIRHARIRNGCSNLHLDLHNNHLRNDPICDCLRSADSAEHYFFKCSPFIEQRINLFNSTRQFHSLNIETILCSRDDLLYENNVIILTAVHKYLKDSPRFD